MQTTILNRMTSSDWNFYEIPSEWLDTHVRLCHMYVTPSKNVAVVSIMAFSKLNLYFHQQLNTFLGDDDLLALYPNGVSIAASDIPTLILSLEKFNKDEEVQWIVEWVPLDDAPSVGYLSISFGQLENEPIEKRIFYHSPSCRLHLECDQPIDSFLFWLEFLGAEHDDDTSEPEFTYQFVSSSRVVFDPTWTAYFRIHYDDESEHTWTWVCANDNV
jgi:hypothetical protein